MPDASASGKEYSFANGVIAAVVCTGAMTVAAFDGLQGDAAGALVFGMLALVLGLQAGNELSWHGRQDHVVTPLTGLFVAVGAVALVWWLFG